MYDSSLYAQVMKQRIVMHKRIALVLEGGGMRGVFTSGALDCFMDYGVQFAYCVGVSAGACNGLSYVSGQRGRAKCSNIDCLERYGYIGLRYLWRQHSILDREMLYDRLPNEILPFDYAACFANPMTFEMVATNCLTGQPEYLSERSDRARLLDIAKASSSLPFVCPMATVDGTPMLDGGIVDSIPLERARNTGHPLLVAILTRNRGYRPTAQDLKTPRFVYRRYPRLRAVLSRRHSCYAKQLALTEHLEDEGLLLPIRPLRPLEVGRMEDDIAKLTALYNEGYACAEAALPALQLLNERASLLPF